MAANDLAVSWYMAAAAARATLRALGATKVALRICTGRTECRSAVGLGLAAPAMERLELAPVMLRTASDGTIQVLVDASTLQDAVGMNGESLDELLATARVEIDEVEKRILAVRVDRLGGAAYLYHLSVEA